MYACNLRRVYGTPGMESVTENVINSVISLTDYSVSSETATIGRAALPAIMVV